MLIDYVPWAKTLFIRMEGLNHVEDHPEQVVSLCGFDRLSTHYCLLHQFETNIPTASIYCILYPFWKAPR